MTSLSVQTVSWSAIAGRVAPWGIQCSDAGRGGQNLYICRDFFGRRLRTCRASDAGRSGRGRTRAAARRGPRARRDARSEAEARWAVAVDRPIHRRPGVRGWLVYPVKRALRKLMSWYVGPFAAEQRAFNEALLRFADELSSRNDELRRRLPVRPDERRSARPSWAPACTPAGNRRRRQCASRRRRSSRRADERRAAARRDRGAAAAARTAARGRGAARPSRPSPAPTPSPTTSRSSRGCAGTPSEIRARQRGYVEDFRERGAGARPRLRARRVPRRCCGRPGSRRAGSTPTRTWSRTRAARGWTSSRGRARRSSRSSTDGSLGGVFAAQLLEHLPPPALVRLLELAAREAPPRRRPRRRDDQPALAARAPQLLRRPDARAAARPRDARSCSRGRPGSPRSRSGS